MLNQNLLKKSGLGAVLVLAVAPFAAYADTAQERLAEAVKVAREETQNTRTELQNTIATLNELQNQKQGDLRPNYEKFSAAVDRTHSAADLTRKLFDSMSAESKTYFDSWKSELSGISNKDIRKTSEKRLKTVEAQYGEVLAKLDKTVTAFVPMLADLDDLRKALGTDLTPAGLKSVGKSISKTNKSLANGQAPVIKVLLAFDKLGRNLTPQGAK